MGINWFFLLLPSWIDLNKKFKCPTALEKRSGAAVFNQWLESNRSIAILTAILLLFFFLIESNAMNWFVIINNRAVFSPSCISHTVLTKRDWQNIRIGDISLPQALRCWELQPYWSVSNHMTHDVTGDVIVVPPTSEEENVASVHPLRHSHSHKRYKAAHLESK